jgi:TRAP-type C4-dicarboxylate transport system substrate-binding protein
VNIIQVPLVNGKYIDSLPEDQKKVLYEAMDIYSDAVHKYTIQAEDESVEKLRGMGIEVVIIDDAMKAEFQKIADQLIVDKIDAAGEKYVNWAKEILDKK